MDASIVWFVYQRSGLCCTGSCRICVVVGVTHLVGVGLARTGVGVVDAGVGVGGALVGVGAAWVGTGVGVGGTGVD
jgi:hypothetical protein